MVDDYYELESLPEHERRMTEEVFRRHKLRLDTFEVASIGFDDPHDDDRRDPSGRFQKRLRIGGTSFEFYVFYNRHGVTEETFDWNAERDYN